MRTLVGIDATLAAADEPRLATRDAAEVDAVLGTEIWRRLEVARRSKRYDLTVGADRRDVGLCRGLEAGADAYFTKSTFDQRELLETIERLIG